MFSLINHLYIYGLYWKSLGITGKNGVIVEIPGDDLTRFHVGFWNSLSRGVPNGKVRESIKMIKGKLMGKLCSFLEVPEANHQIQACDGNS